MRKSLRAYLNAGRSGTNFGFVMNHLQRHIHSIASWTEHVVSVAVETEDAQPVDLRGLPDGLYVNVECV